MAPIKKRSWSGVFVFFVKEQEQRCLKKSGCLPLHTFNNFAYGGSLLLKRAM